MPDPLEFGIVITREDGSIERFLEKPTWGQVFSDTINTGIYVLEPEIFDFIPAEGASDFSGDVFPAVLGGRQADLRVRGRRATGRTSGRPRPTCKAHNDILDQQGPGRGRRVPAAPRGVAREGLHPRPERAWSRGPPSSATTAPSAPGRSSGSTRRSAANVRVADAAEVRHSMIGDNCYVGAGARVEGAAVARACDLREGVPAASPGAVLGENCLIGAGAEVRAGVKVYPFKTVEAGALVNSSIVWESKGSRTLFGRDGVRGIANVDINPELAVRLSMAWVSTLGRGASITASRDTSRTARMLKRAIMVGCNAAGVNVGDLEVATVPVMRHHIRNTSSRGGVTVRLAADDPKSVVLRFFDAEGLDLDENGQRKIERMYHREEFRRVLAPEIGDIDFPARAVEQYTADLVASVPPRDEPHLGGEAGARPLLRLGQLRHAERPGQDRRRRARGEPLRPHRRDDLGRPDRERAARRRARPGVGLASSARWSTPTASTSPSSTTRGRCSPTTRPCSCSCAGHRQREGRPGGAAGVGAQRRRCRSARRPAPPSPTPSSPRPT